MDEELPVPGGEEDAAAPGGGLGYWTYHLWLDDICISIDDCPECLRREDFDCQFCEFFSPADCRLLNEPYLMRETRILFGLCREQRAAQVERYRTLVHAVHSQLDGHGRPLHCTVLAAIMADRHAELDLSAHGIALLMSARPDIFERVGDGVYTCRKGRAG